MEFVRKYRNLAILPLPQMTDVPVENLMNELELLFEENFEKDAILFNWTIEPKDIVINADREQIEQVLINLIKNSIWALENEAEKKINVNCFLTNNRVQIEVQDTGKGLDEELLDKIFIPFFTTHSEGSGIGLSLSRQIILMHGGSISVQSTKEKGAKFVLFFGLK